MKPKGLKLSVEKCLNFAKVWKLFLTNINNESKIMDIKLYIKRMMFAVIVSFILRDLLKSSGIAINEYSRFVIYVLLFVVSLYIFKNKDELLGQKLRFLGFGIWTSITFSAYNFVFSFFSSQLITALILAINIILGYAVFNFLFSRFKINNVN